MPGPQTQHKCTVLLTLAIDRSVWYGVECTVPFTFDRVSVQTVITLPLPQSHRRPAFVPLVILLTVRCMPPSESFRSANVSDRVRRH